MFKQISRLSGSHNLNKIVLGVQRKAATICPNVIHHLNAIQHEDIRSCGTSPQQSPDTRKWDLYSAVCLERHPIITQSMHELEQKFYDMLKKVEFENSLKSDHELRMEKEEKQQSNINNDLDIDSVAIQTAQDFEDSSQEELNNFEFAPTITKFDEQKGTSSLKRKLDKNLLLSIHQKVGDTHHWIPPQGIRQEGETMRQTAERVLQDACGINIKAKFYGNAPIGFYKYRYPVKLREKGIYGAKIFYFLAKYVDGDITDNVKHQWLDYEELEEVLPSQMQKSISQFVLRI